MLIALAWRAPFITATHREGDETDVKLLLHEMQQGKYSLRDTQLTKSGQRRLAYVQSPIYHNPPLFYGICYLVKSVAAEPAIYLVSYLSATILILITFWIGTTIFHGLSGLWAAIILLLCPVTQMTAGKIWIEPFLSLLIILLIADCIHVLRPQYQPKRIHECLIFLLAASITLTKQTGVLVIAPLLIFALTTANKSVQWAMWRRIAGVMLGFMIWSGWLWWKSKQALPAAYLPVNPADISNRFVLGLQQRHPASLFYIPLLLCPFYGLGWLLPQQRQPKTKIWHTALLGFYLTTVISITILALCRIATFHTKYISIALFALALIAGAQFEHLRNKLPKLSYVLAILVAIYCLRMVWIISWRIPPFAEVDPTFFPRFWHWFGR